MAMDIGTLLCNFSMKLLHKVGNEEKNAFFSPTSIAAALGMVLAGADGNTRKQLLSILFSGAEENDVHKGFAELVKAINASNKPFVLDTANRLYSMIDYDVAKSFTELLATQYQSDFKQVDFVDAAEATRVEINTWVEEVTRKKIVDLIPEGVLDARTRLVIVNAIYFKGDWAEKFKASNTVDGDFFVSDTKKVTAKMMKHSFEEYRYGCSDDCEVLRLPYVRAYSPDSTSLSMVIMLPKAKNGLGAFEKKLDGAKFMELVSRTSQRTVHVTLPRFKIEADYSLSDDLAEMGLTDMFSAGVADFGRISAADAKKLFVSAVIHKAFVEVNEEGSEAAAATACTISLMCYVEPLPPVTFTADHPFLFAIMDDYMKCPLFIGHVSNPEC